MSTRRAAVYVRVSTEDQNLDNQLAQIREFAGRRDFNIVSVYQEEESAWRGGRQRELAKLMKDAQGGKFTVVLVWALDRLSREGPLAILTRVHTLGRYGVDLVSLNDSWTEIPSEVKPLMYALYGMGCRAGESADLRANEGGTRPGEGKRSEDRPSEGTEG